MIDTEIIDYFGARRDSGRNVDNDAEFLLSYYGFLEDDFPTYREIAEKYGCTHQWVQYSVNRNIKELRTPRDPLPSIRAVVDLMNIQKVFSSADFASRMVQEGVIARVEECNIMGILRLVQDLGYCRNYEILSIHLSRVAKKEYQRGDDYFLVEAADVELLREGYAKAKTLSGDYGVVGFPYLEEFLGKDYPYFENVCQLIVLKPDNFYFRDEQGQIYFHIGGFKKDGFVSCLARIFSIAERVQIDELVEALRRPIARRQGSKAVSFLPTPVVKQFLHEYPYVRIEDEYVYFLGKSQPLLREIEIDAERFLRERGVVLYPELRDFLLSCKYGLDNIKDTIYHSPIISVNKAFGFGYYEYSLIGRGNWREFIGATIDDIQSDMDVKEDNIHSKEEFEKSLEDARRAGETGEKFINSYLTGCKVTGSIAEYKWESEKNPTSPYDFHIIEIDGSEIFIDVKSTFGRFENNIHISYLELGKMRESLQYLLFRVYQISEKDARLRISENMVEFARIVSPCFEELPFGVWPDSISVNPTQIPFRDEIVIASKLA